MKQHLNPETLTKIKWCILDHEFRWLGQETFNK